VRQVSGVQGRPRQVRLRDGQGALHPVHQAAPGVLLGGEERGRIEGEDDEGAGGTRGPRTQGGGPKRYVAVVSARTCTNARMILASSSPTSTRAPYVEIPRAGPSRSKKARVNATGEVGQPGPAVVRAEAVIELARARAQRMLIDVHIEGLERLVAGIEDDE